MVSSTLELFEKYFGSKDVYQVLGLTKESLEKDIKKAYYKLSLKVHPDRVPDEEKALATEKFKVLAQIHQVLTDKNKKALYDDRGIIDDEDEDGKLATWLEIWRKIFKPISTEDIDNYQKEYVGSEIEKGDIKKAYINGKGCINYMMNCVPFMDIEDEPRIKKIVEAMIEAKEVPHYDIFINEPKAKKNRRHKKYDKERREAQFAKKAQQTDASIENEIMKRQAERASTYESFFDKLLEKYGNEEDTEEFVVDKKRSSKQKKKVKITPSKKLNSNVRETEATLKPKDRRVKNGRVMKTRSQKQ